MPRKKRSPETRYSLAEGAPSRIHEDKDGDLTGDAYRSATHSRHPKVGIFRALAQFPGRWMELD